MLLPFHLKLWRSSGSSPGCYFQKPAAVTTDDVIDFLAAAVYGDIALVQFHHVYAVDVLPRRVSSVHDAVIQFVKAVKVGYDIVCGIELITVGIFR